MPAGWPNEWPANLAKLLTPRPNPMKISSGAVIAAILLFAAASNAQIVEKKSLNLDGAKKAIAAAVDYAKKNNAPGGVVAAVDGFTPLIGGLPIVIDGQVVGGIGVSGAASAAQDEELALAGANALMGGQAKIGAAPMSKEKPGSVIPGTTAQATFVEPSKVSAAFAKGMPLLETAGYKVHASRRVEPGQAEIHTLDTDVIYVVDGSATLVTGGKAIDTKEIAPNEIRGTKIEGGQEHQITKGEVIIIPNGVPHQFTAVTGELHYFVCKPTAPAETHLTAR